MIEIPDNLWRICESPIEHMLIGGFLTCRNKGKGQIKFVVPSPSFDELPAFFAAERTRIAYRGFWLHIFPQVTIENYRVDFLVVASGNTAALFDEPRVSHRVVVVEADGKEFHRDQRREQKRNSFFVHQCGFTVLHFTGSEIFRDAARCADAVICHASEQLWQSPKELDWHTGAFVDEGLKPLSRSSVGAIDAAHWAYLAPGGDQ